MAVRGILLLQLISRTMYYFISSMLSYWRVYFIEKGFQKCHKGTSGHAFVLTAFEETAENRAEEDLKLHIFFPSGSDATNGKTILHFLREDPNLPGFVCVQKPRLLEWKTLPMDSFSSLRSSVQ